MRTRIHVNKHNIAYNKKNLDQRPVFTVKTYKGIRRGNTVCVDGPCEFVYSPDKPLSCGAVAWVETTEKVRVYA